MLLSPEAAAGFHGNNEKLSIDNLNLLFGSPELAARVVGGSGDGAGMGSIAAD